MTDQKAPAGNRRGLLPCGPVVVSRTVGGMTVAAEAAEASTHRPVWLGWTLRASGVVAAALVWLLLALWLAVPLPVSVWGALPETEAEKEGVPDHEGVAE